MDQALTLKLSIFIKNKPSGKQIDQKEILEDC